MLKKALYSLIALALGGFIALLLCEFLVRLFCPWAPVELWFEASARYGHQVKADFYQQYRYPGHDFIMEVQTNTLGHRDEPWDAATPFSGKTVLFLGDSFTFGYAINVADRFDRRIKKELHACTDRLRFINAGVPGWGTLQETRYARDHFQDFRPDVIVLTFCGNDPEDDRRFLRGESAIAHEGVLSFPGKQWLRNHAALYRFVLAQTKAIRHHLLLKKQQRQTEPPRVDPQSGGRLEQGWEAQSRQAIMAFHRDFLRFNPEGRLVIQATDPENPAILAGLMPLDNGDNLRVLPFSEAMNRLAPEERRLPWDGHWSPLMHRLSAQLLLQALRPFLAEACPKAVPLP